MFREASLPVRCLVYGRICKIVYAGANLKCTVNCSSIIVTSRQELNPGPCVPKRVS